MPIVTVRVDLTPSSVHHLGGPMTVFTRAREALYLGFRIDCVNNTQQQDSKGDAHKLRNECHGDVILRSRYQDSRSVPQ
jgi:hypothetical protein